MNPHPPEAFRRRGIRKNPEAGAIARHAGSFRQDFVAAIARQSTRVTVSPPIARPLRPDNLVARESRALP